MEYELMIGKDRAVSLVQDNSIGKLIKPLSREIQLFDSYVAGTGYGDAEALGDVCEDVPEGELVGYALRTAEMGHDYE